MKPSYSKLRLSFEQRNHKFIYVKLGVEIKARGSYRRRIPWSKAPTASFVQKIWEGEALHWFLKIPTKKRSMVYGEFVWRNAFKRGCKSVSDHEFGGRMSWSGPIGGREVEGREVKLLVRGVKKIKWLNQKQQNIERDERSANHLRFHVIKFVVSFFQLVIKLENSCI